MPIQLSNQDRISIKTILDNHLVDVSYMVFGSRAKGTATPYSDIDIALVSKQPISLLTLSALEEAFAESDLVFKVDLLDWQRISPEFRQKISNEWQQL